MAEMRRCTCIAAVSTGARMGEAGQGGAIGAQQERGLDQIALRLLDRECGEIAVVERALAHHAIDGAAELFRDLVEPELRDVGVAAALFGEPGMGVVDRLLAALDRHIGHAQPSAMATLRGSAARAVAGAEDEVDAAREPRVVARPSARRNPPAARRPRRTRRRRRARARRGAGRRVRCRAPRPAGSSVAAFSGASSVPASSAARSGRAASQREARRRRSARTARRNGRRSSRRTRRGVLGQPERRVGVEQRQQHRGRRAPERRGRRQAARRRDARGRAATSHRARRESRSARRGTGSAKPGRSRLMCASSPW